METPRRRVKSGHGQPPSPVLLVATPASCWPCFQHLSPPSTAAHHARSAQGERVGNRRLLSICAFVCLSAGPPLQHTHPSLQPPVHPLYTAVSPSSHLASPRSCQSVHPCPHPHQAACPRDPRHFPGASPLAPTGNANTSAAKGGSSAYRHLSKIPALCPPGATNPSAVWHREGQWGPPGLHVLMPTSAGCIRTQRAAHGCTLPPVLSCSQVIFSSGFPETCLVSLLCASRF